jgi:hypothetical protein
VSPGCASNADIAAQQSARFERLESQAHSLFAALEQVASQRALPIVLRDAEGLRLTSDWILESDGLRRRYFLAVLRHPAGNALHVNIVRQRQEDSEGFGEPIWTRLERTEEVAAEEQALIEEAYGLWREGGD